jgi:hypothetical protein
VPLIDACREAFWPDMLDWFAGLADHPCFALLAFSP